MTRFARFAQAISSTNPTAACNAQIERLAVPTIASCNGRIWRRVVYRARGTVRRNMVLRARTLAPVFEECVQLRLCRLRRDAVLQSPDDVEDVGRRDPRAVSGWSQRGNQIWVRLSMTSTPGGMMPRISWGRPSTFTVFPTSGCPPKAVCHNSCERIAIGGSSVPVQSGGFSRAEEASLRRLNTERVEQMRVHSIPTARAAADRLR